MKARRQLIQGTAGLLLAGALFWVAGRSLEWQSVRSVLSSAHFGWVTLSWLTILAGAAIRGWRWQALYPSQTAPRWLDLTSFLIIGQFLNTVIPVRMGEVAQAYLASKSSQTPMGANLSLILVLKFLDGIAVLCSALILGLTLTLPEWFSTATWAFAALFAGLLVGLATVLWLREPLKKLVGRLPLRLGRLMATALDGLSAIVAQGRLWPALALTVLLWVLNVASEYTLFFGLGVAPTAAGALLLVVSHYMSALIPGVPAQVGVFHYVTMLCLGLFGVSQASGMSYAIVLHALIYGTTLITGAVVLWLKSIDLGAIWRLRDVTVQEEDAA